MAFFIGFPLFPRNLGVRRGEKILAFLVVFHAFSKKQARERRSGFATLSGLCVPSVLNSSSSVKKCDKILSGCGHCATQMGEAFLLTVGAFPLTVELLCLQSLKALIGCTFPL